MRKAQKNRVLEKEQRYHKLLYNTDPLLYHKNSGIARIIFKNIGADKCGCKVDKTGFLCYYLSLMSNMEVV